MNETDPIATYREQRFDGKRVFELFADHVRVKGSMQFASEFEITIPLATLNPIPMRLRVRNKSFWSGQWLLLIAVVVDTVLVSGFHLAPESVSVAFVGILGMIGFLFMLATARKVEFIAFTSTAGVDVLDFARSGSDARNLDSFVALVSKGITDSTGNA